MNITRILPWALLILLALTSAILCMTPPSLGGLGGLALLYVGTVYGVFLGVYFATCRGVRDTGMLIILVVLSAVAWLVAYYGSFLAMGFIPEGTVRQGDVVQPAFPLVAFGGVLGGASLLIPLLLLLKPSSVSRDAALAKALLGILLSGIVGGIAWGLGPTLGAAIWALLPPEPLPRPDSYNMAALFFVWQPVIALFIAWATLGNRTPLQTQANGLKSGVNAPASRLDSTLTGRVFIVVVACLVVLSLVRVVPLRLSRSNREAAATKIRGYKLSDLDLPVVQPIAKSEALILKQIGDYRLAQADRAPQAAARWSGMETPASIFFRATYTKIGEPAPQTLATPGSVWVIVQQYPNNAWANYFTEHPRYVDYPKPYAIVLRFNSKLRSNEAERSIGQTAHPLYFLWPSGDCVLTVLFVHQEDLEILRAYLEKYPSSLP